MVIRLVKKNYYMCGEEIILLYWFLIMGILGILLNIPMENLSLPSYCL